MTGKTTTEGLERRWTIPTCPKCGSLVVKEGGYDGEYTVCSNYDCDEFDRDHYPHPEPIPVEVIPAVDFEAALSLEREITLHDLATSVRYWNERNAAKYRAEKAESDLATLQARNQVNIDGWAKCTEMRLEVETKLSTLQAHVSGEIERLRNLPAREGALAGWALADRLSALLKGTLD